jgi:hypothetical protein
VPSANRARKNAIGLALSTSVSVMNLDFNMDPPPFRIENNTAH